MYFGCYKLYFHQKPSVVVYVPGLLLIVVFNISFVVVYSLVKTYHGLEASMYDVNQWTFHHLKTSIHILSTMAYHVIPVLCPWCWQYWQTTACWPGKWPVAWSASHTDNCVCILIAVQSDHRTTPALKTSMDGWVDGWIGRWMGMWMNEWTDEWMNEWMNEWIMF